MAVTRDEYEFIARFRTEALEAARQAQDAMEGMGASAQGAAEDAHEAADGLAEVARVTAQVTAAFVSARASMGFIGEGLQEFANLETRMTAIAKVSSLTASELDALGDSFEDVAADMGLPIEMFTDAAQVAGQLGIDGVENIGAFTDAMVKLAGASDLAGADGATAIARILNITGEGVTEAGRFSSVVVELGNNVAATESEIVHMAGEIARATATFGTSSTFVGGMGAAMAELGLRAETAGTAVGRVMTDMTLAMATGADEAQVFADAMGLTIQQFNALVDTNPEEALLQFLAGLNAMGETPALQVLDELKLANAETVKSLAPLITNYERFRDVLKLANDEAARPDALENESMAAAATLARDYAGLLEDVRNAMRDMGETWAPLASLLIDGGKAIMDAFNGLPDFMKDFLNVAVPLAPALLAGQLALAGVAGAMNLLLPATVRQTAAAGALSASMLGMGRAGQVAGAGLAVARAGMTALLGPIGLIASVAGVAALALWDTSDSVENMEDTLAGAETAMDAYAKAVAKAKEEQLGLKDGTTAATQAILDQARAQMQQAMTDLQLQIKGTLNLEIDDAEASRVSGQISESMEDLELAAELNPDLTGLTDMLGLLDGLKSGTVTFDQFRDRFESMASIGNDAIGVVSSYRNAIANAASEQDMAKATRDLIRYAQTTGKFSDELDHIMRMLESGDASATALAVADLAAAMEDSAEVGNTLREVLPASFIEAITQAADAEVQVAALNAALQGNHDLAKQILETGNPFAVLEDGAKDAEEQVNDLTDKMVAAYTQYQQLRGLGGLNVAPNEDGQELLDQIAKLADGKEAAAVILRDLEGFRDDAYDDWTWRDGKRVNSGLRVGYGSGTVTDEKGNSRPVREGDTVTVAEANRDLYRRIGEYQKAIVDQIGQERFDSFTPAQQGALTSIAYNYGQLPGRIVDAVRNGSSSVIGAAISGLQGDNNGVNAERRRTEAGAFTQGIGVTEAEERWQDDYNASLRDQLKAAQDALKARKDLMAANEEALEQAEFEASLLNKTAGEQARLRTEHELLTQAKREGIDVDTEMTANGRTYRAEIEATARAVGDLAQQEEDRSDTLQKVIEEQQFYNDLQKQTQDGILDVILEGESLADTMSSLAKAFARAALEAALFDDGALGGDGGGGILGGLIGSVFSRLGGTGTTEAVSATIPNAKGNVFYQSATIPLARGSALLGEAGPEGVLPLKRMADGSLGVHADGGAGGGMSVTYAPTFHIDANGGVKQSSGGGSAAGYEALMRNLDAEVRTKVLEVLGREMQNGGMLNPAAKPYG